MAGISKWYVVHTYSGYENKVMDNIQKAQELIELLKENPDPKIQEAYAKQRDQILDVCVPTETVEETKESGEVKQVERKLYPGYVFVKLAVTEENGEYSIQDDIWHRIFDIQGVTGFVGPESNPVPLSNYEVKNLGVEHKTVTVDYAVGDYVKIIDGPMKDFTGRVDSIDIENDKTVVIVSMFGRDTRAEVTLNQVESALGK